MVYLPRVHEEAPRLEQAPPSSSCLKGTETVLLVEDDEKVRGVARTILRRSGYDVVEAANGGEALLICEQLERPIHVLLTDVVMPRMSGRLLARRLSEIRPGMRVVCMSGHTPADVEQRELLPAGAAFIQKPFAPDDLLAVVRGALSCADDWGRCVAPLDRAG